MYRGKHEMPRKGLAKYKKSHIMLVSLLLVMTIGVGATVAFLMDSTDALENVFNPSHVSCSVSENFEGSVKTNVSIENTSDIPAYIRATYVINWVDKDKNIVVPPNDYSYEIVMGESGDWTKVGEYYYYGKVVPAHNEDDSDLTAVLISRVEPKYPDDLTIEDAPYYLQVEIIAEAIQAEGMGATSAQKAFAEAAGGGA